MSSLACGHAILRKVSTAYLTCIYKSLPILLIHGTGIAFQKRELSWKRWWCLEKYSICLQILAYLVDHPDARDTLDGIIEWWLLEREIKYQTKVIKDALSDLVEKGLVLEHQEKDLRYHYGINPAEIERVQAFLKQCDK